MSVGLGVMMKALAGSNPSEDLAEVVGKKILGIRFDESSLDLRFGESEGIRISDEGQSCCEHRYMTTDDALEDFVGADFLGAEVREGGETDDDEYGVHEVEFLVVKTSLGDFTVETHNEHNGYYGGFWMEARKIEWVWE